MNQTIKLDTRKRESSFCEERIYPLRRGERNNVTLTVAVRRDRRPYDLTGMTAHLVWQAADGKLVGPVPMEVTDQAAGTVRCTLPDACYSAVGTARAYIELRRGAELVDTTDEMLIEVLDCIDADGEQAEEYKPLIAEVREATDAAIKAATKAVSDTQAAIAEVKATEAKLYPVAENILVRSETGAVAHVEDAFAGASLRKITVEGACKQDGTPTPNNPVPIVVVENPVVKVVGQNLANPSQAYYFAADGKPKAEQIADGFRFVVTNNSTRFLAVPCELKKGDTIVVNFDTKQLSGNTQRIQIYFPATSEYVQIGKPHVMADDAVFIGIYIEAGAVGEYDVTNFRVSRNVDDGYKPYTSQTLTFTLPAEHPYLAKLPDGTADEIVVDEEGNVELVARVARRELTTCSTVSSSAPQSGEDGTMNYVLIAEGAEDAKVANAAACICTRFKDGGTTKNADTIRRGAGNGLCYIYTSNAAIIGDGTTQHVTEWLAANPTEILYEVAEPTRYTLGKIEMPRAQDNIVNAWTDAEVTPNTSISYVRDVNIVVANIESAIASITEG